HRQTRDQILRILQNGIAAFNMNKKMGCTFIDIEKAFYKVWHLGLLYKLNSLKIPCYLDKWLANYLTNRTFMMRIGNCLSNAQNIQTGVPQGIVLGPTLFNIFFNDIVNVLKDVDIALYADDLSFWVASTSVNYINLKLQQNLEKIYEWMCKWRLKVSSNKTFLGVTLDPGLRLHEYTKIVIERTVKRLNLIKSIGGKNWGA
ncbi:unnamed protein product, partial [Brachionus calyciflorus]